MQVYDSKKPYVNRPVLVDLKNMKADMSLDNTKNLISNLLDTRFLCAMVTRSQNERFEAFSPYLLVCDDKEYVLPIFTSELEIVKGQHEFDEYTPYILDFDDIMEIFQALNTKMPLSIVIDPYGSNFTITESMLSIVANVKQCVEEKA